MFLGLRGRRILLCPGGDLGQRSFLGLVFSTTQDRRNGAAELSVFKRLPNRRRHLLCLVLVRLRGREHHYEKCKQKSNEIRIRDQPALVVLMAACWFPGHESVFRRCWSCGLGSLLLFRGGRSRIVGFQLETDQRRVEPF